MKTLYYNKFSARFLCVLRVAIGLMFLIYAISLIQKGIYLDTFSIIGPILGFSLFINGLTAFKIQRISHDLTRQSIEIIKISLFKEKHIHIPLNQFKTDLRSNSGQFAIFPQIRLVLINNNDDVEEIKSNPFSTNNQKIKKLYAKLRVFNKKET